DIKSVYNRPSPKSSPVRGKGPSGDDSGEFEAARPCVPRFRRSWSRCHFKRKSRVYSFEPAELNSAESVLRKKFEAYFYGFDKGKSGEDRFINTKDVLQAADREQRAAIFETMSDELAYWNLMAAKVGFKPIVADGSGDIELNSDFAADASECEGCEGEGGSKKRHNLGSTKVISVRIPSSASPVNVGQFLSFFQSLTPSVSSPVDLTIADRSQRSLNSLGHIVYELFESASLLAYGPVALESSNVITAFEARVGELEAENARLNVVLVTKTGEVSELQSFKKKSSKKIKGLEKDVKVAEARAANMEALEGRVASFEEDIKKYGAPSQLCEERDKLKKDFGDVVVRSVRGITAGFEEALALVEEKNPGLTLDLSVYKMSALGAPGSAVKTPSSTGGGV
ncbi:hypothetical protein A2U01_0001417, partial [Trifolium medium]|nr:hypothetical protein [Trifolium medium]